MKAGKGEKRRLYDMKKSYARLQFGKYIFHSHNLVSHQPAKK